MHSQMHSTWLGEGYAAQKAKVKVVEKQAGVAVDCLQKQKVVGTVQYV